MDTNPTVTRCPRCDIDTTDRKNTSYCWICEDVLAADKEQAQRDALAVKQKITEELHEKYTELIEFGMNTQREYEKLIAEIAELHKRANIQ